MKRYIINKFNRQLVFLKFSFRMIGNTEIIEIMKIMKLRITRLTGYWLLSKCY